jgi:hypothetical protein
MPNEGMNWVCPHCHRHVTIVDARRSTQFHKFWIETCDGKVGVSTEVIACPNGDCLKATVNVGVHKWTPGPGSAYEFLGKPLASIRLVPFGASRTFPDYVPSAIRQDYSEACLIKDLSPKAAATLARRALQGILRDFYKAKPGNLVKEIESLKDKMEPELLDAIDGIRSVGNIGAHMEKDIDVIVDVDPGEAKLLIELVETMIEETYVRRQQRAERLQKVSALAKVKEQERKGPVKLITEDNGGAPLPVPPGA